MGNKCKVFIGASSENSDIADTLNLLLSPISEVTHWLDASDTGLTIFDNLINLKDKFYFAVFILTANDFLYERGDHYQNPRDNVLFELGLFLGSIGPGRVFAAIDASITTKLPSDLSGVIYFTYDLNRSDGQLDAALRPTLVLIKKEISRRGARNLKNDRKMIDYPNLGISHVYASYAEAERDIISEIRRSTGPIKIFMYIGSQSVGIKGPILDVIESASHKGVEFQILRSNPRSKIFSKERIESIGKNYSRISSTLEFVSNVFEELGSNRNLYVKSRMHDFPFIWRFFITPKHVYVMPYFSQKDATHKSPVVQFKNIEHSIYHSFDILFSHIWEAGSPKQRKISDIITPSSSCGAALILNWEGRHVFGIPRRDASSPVVRLYGIGGKFEIQDETLENCAIREGNEETDGSISALIDSDKTQFIDKNGVYYEIEVVDAKIKPAAITVKNKDSGVFGDKISPYLHYTFCYYAEASKKPKPCRELMAIVILDDDHLKILDQRSDITIAGLKDLGAEIEEANPGELNERAIVIALGTAKHLIRLKR